MSLFRVYNLNYMLSIIVLTKNSEETITPCLESLRQFGDELLVVDSDSRDKTRQIAEKLGAKVIVHTFTDFASQRNFALEKAKGNWVLYIDSDEEITKEFREEVASILVNHNSESGVDGYFIKRRTFYFGKDWGFVDKVQRLFYKPNFLEWYGVVHETPKIKGSFGIVESPILHFTHRRLSQMLEKTNEWSEYEAELRFKAHHPQMSVLRFFRVMITGFLDSYVFDKGYKNGAEGIIESVYQSFSMFITYAKLWEKQRKKK